MALLSGKETCTLSILGCQLARLILLVDHVCHLFEPFGQENGVLPTRGLSQVLVLHVFPVLLGLYRVL